MNPFFLIFSETFSLIFTSVHSVLHNSSFFQLLFQPSLFHRHPLACHICFLVVVAHYQKSTEVCKKDIRWLAHTLSSGYFHMGVIFHIYHSPCRHFHIFRVMLLYGIIDYSHGSRDNKSCTGYYSWEKWKCKLGRNVGRDDFECRRHSGDGEYLIG